MAGTVAKAWRARGVIFDLDSTLLRTKINFRRIRERIECPKAMGILEFLETVEDEENRKVFESVVLEEEELGREGAELLPGAIEVLSALVDAEIPHALLTRNDEGAVEHFLELLRAEMKPNFALTLHRDAPFPPKPDPAPALHILSEAMSSISAEDVLFVGDAVDDLKCGRAAGTKTCLVGPGNGFLLPGESFASLADFHFPTLHPLTTLL